MSVDREHIARVVRELLSSEIGSSAVGSSASGSSAVGSSAVGDRQSAIGNRQSGLGQRTSAYPSAVGASALHAARCERPAPPLHEIDAPAVESVIQRLVRTTSSQIAVGHRGLRFKTDLYLRMREGSADAKDAVHSEVPDDWAAAHGLLSLKSRCEDRTEHLLYPNHGRRLDEKSLAALGSAKGSRPDVQVIIGDGLSSNAVLKNGTESLQELQRALSAAGYRAGTGMFVKYARIGVADEIGVLTGARATVIVVGERPGLGTGDSLSFYIAVNPKLDQDNAEKNCISNVRGIGIKPHEAADLTVTILQRAFAIGGGGVAIGFGFGRT